MTTVRTTPSKRGVPKAKGAVRAKSGCYTCRIRRKKCDEQLSDGRCRTCVRLRLECLGFGSKRPDWLRETHNVAEVREKIKNFLASHGMIKGHTGTVAPRDSDVSPTLRLSGDTSDSSQSPSTPTLSICSETLSSSDGLITGHPYTLSSVRDEHLRWDTTPTQEYSHPNMYQSTLLTPESPYSTPGSIHDLYLPAIECSASLVPSPAIHSTFSRLSHVQFLDEDYNMGSESEDVMVVSRNPPTLLPFQEVDKMMRDYVEKVIHLQYLFDDGTRMIQEIICETVSHERPQAAARLLVSVHNYRFYRPQQRAFETLAVRDRLKSLESLLSSKTHGAQDAVAALHVVSSILFDGGQGSWKEWLGVANRYVDRLFQRHDSPAEVLIYSSPKDTFIIKTAIWFDVLASVTTQEVPHFLSEIRGMFGPQHPKLYDNYHQYSMMSPMGCENIIVWALAETSFLAHWKAMEKKNGSLSMPDLVLAAQQIENQAYQMNSYPQPGAHSLMRNGNLQGLRQLASEIFRSATRLYLRTVVSGDYPRVPEIKESVNHMVQRIQEINRASLGSTDSERTLAGSIVRNTVFGFFICGAFADDKESQGIVLEQVQRQGEGAGNCGSVQKLLQGLWARRGADKDRSVPWRETLRETETLLV